MSEATPLWRWDGERPVVDDDDILHYGARWVALGPVEARMASELAAHAGALVRRADLERAGWEGQPVRSNTATRQVQRLRGHVEAVGLVLVTVRGHGYVLEVARDVAGPPTRLPGTPERSARYLGGHGGKTSTA